MPAERLIGRTTRLSLEAVLLLCSMIAVMIARRSISASSVPAGAAVVKATGAGAAGAGAAGAAGAAAFFLN